MCVCVCVCVCVVHWHCTAQLSMLNIEKRFRNKIIIIIIIISMNKPLLYTVGLQGPMVFVEQTFPEHHGFIVTHNTLGIKKKTIACTFIYV